MVTIYPDEDAYIQDYNPDDNEGGGNYLICDNYSVYAAAFYIQFPLLRKPIKAATINLYCYSDNATSDIRHRGLIEQFDEYTVTWNNPGVASPEFSVDVSVIDSAWNSYAIANILNRTVAEEWGGSEFSQQNYTTNHNETVFYSKEGDSGNSKPYLDVTYYAIDEVAGEEGSALEAGETWYWWGTIHVDSIDCISSPRKVQVDITTPWGTTYNNQILTDGISYTWQNGVTNEYFMIVPQIFCGGTNLAQFKQYWWFGAPTFYVKTGGDDTWDGLTWDTAWATVNAGMVRIPNDGTLRVGFGTYSSEPANNTLSPDGSDVTIIYETTTTGGGTGTAIVEVN